MTQASLKTVSHAPAPTSIGMSQNGFARWLKRRGDDRKEATIQRHIERLASGESRVTGEMRVILSMMRAGQRRALRQRGLLGQDGAQQAGTAPLSDA